MTVPIPRETNRLKGMEMRTSVLKQTTKQKEMPKIQGMRNKTRLIQSPRSLLRTTFMLEQEGARPLTVIV